MKGIFPDFPFEPQNHVEHPLNFFPSIRDNTTEYPYEPSPDPREVGISRPANPKQAYGDKKIPVHLVPPAADLYMGMALKEGARKYGAYNWRKNDVEAMTYVGAAKRHIMQYLDGEDIDPDTGEAQVPHIAAAMACLAILADATEGGNLIDNRPPWGPATHIIQERQL